MPTPSSTQRHTGAAWGWGSRPPTPSRPPLTIRRSPTGFVVEDPALTRLAGLGPLPLPFTPQAAPDEVLAHLQRLNPHREVRLDTSVPPDTHAENAPASLHPKVSGASRRPASANRQVGEASDIPHPSCG